MNTSFLVPPGKITSRTNPIPQTMANRGFFQVPADDVGRAKKFYQSLPGWKIEPVSLECARVLTLPRTWRAARAVSSGHIPQSLMKKTPKGLSGCS